MVVILIAVVTSLCASTVGGEGFVDLSNTRNIRFDQASNSHSSKKPNVALVTAGAIRSFAFVARSWERYIFSQGVNEIFVFAHVLSLTTCPLNVEGVAILRKIVTEIEIVESSAPYGSYDNLDRSPDFPYSSREYLKYLENMGPGNFIDMWARRNRAYYMAKSYGKRNNFKWDLLCFVRLDTAFYHSNFNFPSWIISLTKYETVYNRSSIIIPRPCNFDGICDRFAAGLPSAMDIYFQKNWVYEVFSWYYMKHSITNVHRNLTATKLISGFHLKDRGSEYLLRTWLFMNNIDSVYPKLTRNYPLIFITLRHDAINLYCLYNRTAFTYASDALHWTDKVLSYFDNSRKPIGFDMVANPYRRCGFTSRLNITEICTGTPACHC